MTLQVILVLITLTVDGERRSTNIEQEDISHCYGAAHELLQTIARDFEPLGLRSASAACFIRVKPRPA